MKRAAGKLFNIAAALLGGAAAALLALPAPAVALDAAAEQALIGAALQAGYAKGYAARDAVGILALYDRQAEIVTFTAGRVDKEAFAALLGRVLAGWGAAEALVGIEKAAFTSESEALVTFRLQVSGTSLEGKPLVRNDRWHALLRREGAGWLIVKQSYREDFGVSDSPHGGKDKGAAPAPAGGHGGWH